MSGGARRGERDRPAGTPPPPFACTGAECSRGVGTAFWLWNGVIAGLFLPALPALPVALAISGGVSLAACLVFAGPAFLLARAMRSVRRIGVQLAVWFGAGAAAGALTALVVLATGRDGVVTPLSAAAIVGGAAALCGLVVMSSWRIVARRSVAALRSHAP